MKSIKNIFLLNAIAMYSMHFSSFGTVLLAALFITAIDAAGDPSYTVPAGASFEFECESGTGDKCCDLIDQFRSTGSAGGKQTNTAEGTCMTNQGEFKHCEEQSNCTVTCSAGCTGKNVEENSDHDSTEPGVSTSSDCNCSGEGVCDCNSGGCSGSGCISKSEVITLAWTTAGFVFTAVFLAI